MRKDYRKYQSISLSVIIKRDLKKLKMSQKSLAAKIDMSYSHVNRLLNSTCNFNPVAEEKIEKLLGYEDSFISNLREVQKQIHSNGNNAEKRSKLREIDIPQIRKCVFWDINPSSLDWSLHQKFIMSRVARYGNEHEREEVSLFYKEHENS